MLGLLALLCAHGADEEVPDAPAPPDPASADVASADATVDLAEDRAPEDLAPALEGRVPPRRIRLIPMRLELRAPFRDDVGFGAVTALGFQLTRTEKTTFDLDLAYTSGRALLVPGPFRSFLTFEVAGQTNTTLTRWLGLGAVAGVWLRAYRQQFTAIDESFVPVVGLRGESTLLRARRWSAVVSGRFTTDLVLTRVVLEDARVAWMSPFEAQLGLRLNFGHGRTAEAW